MNLNYKINANDHFQWFYLKDLNKIIDFVIKKNIFIYNVATEPISNKELVTKIASKYSEYLIYEDSKSYYDKRTKYNNYLFNKVDIFDKLNEFISF